MYTIEYQEIEFSTISALLKNETPLFVTATRMETTALHKQLLPIDNYTGILKFTEDNTTYHVGKFGNFTIVHVDCGSMGSLTSHGSIITISNAITYLNPKFVLMIGLAFGIDRGYQNIGDVLISETIMPYEIQEVGKKETISRHRKPEASSDLMNVFKNIHDWQYLLPNKKNAQLVYGDILSGEKLVGNIDFSQQLKKMFPTAEGGEMESAGLYEVCKDKKKEWILVKSICDFADGEKNENQGKNQEIAANAAVNFCLHVFNKNLVFNNFGMIPTPKKEENKLYTLFLKTTDKNYRKYNVEYFDHWHTKYGNGHFHLAALAAFPLHLTADLLYKIWQNFKNTEGGGDIPRVAVSDLLLSGLLHEVSTELFEYAPDLRHNLLQALQEYYGEREILKELGTFMLDYLATHYAEGVAYTEPIRESEEWNALAYYAPAQANAKLAAALNPLATNNYQTRQLRAVFVAEKLEAQSFRHIDNPSVQKSFERILTFSKGMKRYIQGDLGKAYEHLVQLPDFRIKGENEGFTERGATLELPKGVVAVPQIEEEIKPVPTIYALFEGEGEIFNMKSDSAVYFSQFLFDNINLPTYNLKVYTENSLMLQSVLNEGDVILVYKCLYDDETELKNKPFDYRETEWYKKNINIAVIHIFDVFNTFLREERKRANEIYIISHSPEETAKTIKIGDKTIGLFTHKLVEVLQNAEKLLNYSELFSRIYAKVTQQTDKQHPQIHAFGNANLQDFFLNDMLKTQNTEGVSLPKMKVGFGDSITEDFKNMVNHVFRSTGKSLFFNIVDNKEKADYLIQFDTSKNEYTLETIVGDLLIFPPIRYIDNNDLITFFNNIDRVANWQFTLAINSNASTASIDRKAIDINFYNLGFDGSNTVEPTDWRHPVVVEIEKNKEAYIQLKITNNGVEPLWISALFLSKNFGVTNEFLQIKQAMPSEIVYLKCDSDNILPVYIPNDFINQGQKSLTEYFKIFISTEQFSTNELNRDPLSIHVEMIRRIDDRSTYHQTGKWVYKNMVVKTVIMTLKLKEIEATLSEAIAALPWFNKRLSLLHLVNCSRKNAINQLYGAFDKKQSIQEFCSLYFICGDYTERPTSLAERLAYEIIDNVSIESNAVNYMLNANTYIQRIIIENLPMNALGDLEQNKLLFKKYFAERFNRTQDNFESVIEKLPYSHVITIFSVPEDSWRANEEELSSYLQWILDTFNNKDREDTTKFLFLFVFEINENDKLNISKSNDKILEQLALLSNKNDIPLVQYLLPVEERDLKEWFYNIGIKPTDSDKVIEAFWKTLSPEGQLLINGERLYRMMDIEVLQQMIYQHSTVR